MTTQNYKYCNNNRIITASDIVFSYSDINICFVLCCATNPYYTGHSVFIRGSNASPVLCIFCNGWYKSKQLALHNNSHILTSKYIQYTERMTKQLTTSLLWQCYIEEYIFFLCDMVYCITITANYMAFKTLYSVIPGKVVILSINSTGLQALPKQCGSQALLVVINQINTHFANRKVENFNQPFTSVNV